ncbi:MAG: hypothetical protein CSA84_02735 [Actinomycetales bacterium]|nr:MAG: hypothetical protein CSA84_02735 [Actinomycetales bacterium]
MTSTRWLWTALARPLVAVLAAGMLVVGASCTSDELYVGPLAPAADAPAATLAPIRENLLVCPGFEPLGLGEVPENDGVQTKVWAGAAPEAALGPSPGDTPDDSGSVRLTQRPDGAELATTSDRGSIGSSEVGGTSFVEVTGSGSLAPGLASVQTSRVTDGDDRGLAATACLAPRPEVWLLAGGGDSTRRERLVIANPGANTVTVDVAVHGAEGLLETSGSGRVTVPPHDRVSLLLDGLVAAEATPAVHLTATGGSITAVLEDSWIEGATGRGRDEASPSVAPALEQIIPAPSLTGPARLRLVVPGPAEAVVQVQLLTSAGPQSLAGGGVSRVRGGSVLDLPLEAVAPGDYAVHVRSDQPVTAAVLIERRGVDSAGQSDLGWMPAVPAVTTLAGSPLPGDTSARLVLAGVGEPWSGIVHRVAVDGSSSAETVSGSVDSVVAVDVSGSAAVWVQAGEHPVYAGLAVAVDDPDGPLFALIGVEPTAVARTVLPAIEVLR